MPELPEVETVRRTLAPGLRGAVVQRVRLLRPDIVRAPQGRSRRPRADARGADLLQGQAVLRVARHGKELALVGPRGSVCVHLGMTGRLRLDPVGGVPRRGDHVHCVWDLAPRPGRAPRRLVFSDPRRFGGLWPYPSLAALRAQRWSALGPDALQLDAPTLAPRLAGRRRAIKAVLLDQGVVAGIGNIYADEILFAARIHPLACAAALDRRQVARLAAAARRILRRAVDCGGSTVRDYADAMGRPGGYARRHKVYGRAGAGCPRCGGELAGSVVAQRTTVHCPACQPLWER